MTITVPIVDFTPAKVNVVTVQGDEVALPITITEAGVPVDLTSRTYTARLRRGDVIVALEVDRANVVAGQLVLRLGDEETSGFTAKEYQWSLRQTAPVARTIVGGDWLFEKSIDE